MKTITRLMIILISFGVFISCKKDNEENDTAITKTEITGAVQKGPFLNGTSIDFYELDLDLIPTGNVYSSQIIDNSGVFQLNNISLISQYVQLKANGYYFDEISGENSNSPIILYALTDITNKTSVNVNVLSHLAKGRIEYLMQTESKSYSDAKTQAEQEVLNIFSIQKNDIVDFDMLDISNDGDDNAILLAISLITKGYRSESEFSDLLANINTDIRQDGILNSTTLGSSLINDTKELDLVEIRNNLEGRYQNMGINATIPDFEQYVNIFIDSTEYVYTNFIQYPENGSYGENILFLNTTEYSSGQFSMLADLPDGTMLKIKIQGTNWSYPVSQDWTGWSKGDWNSSENSRVFWSRRTGEIDLKMYFTPGSSTIYYYENDTSVVSRTKNIIIN